VLKGLGHEIEFKYFAKNWILLAKILGEAAHELFLMQFSPRLG
jgi:hypothetical protein